MKYEFSKTCSFEQDINDTSLEHDAVSTKPYPKKLIAYIRGDYKNQWWTGYFGVHEKLRTAQTDREETLCSTISQTRGSLIWIRLSLFARVTVKILKAFGFTPNVSFAITQ